jgi:hypothetical protein
MKVNNSYCLKTKIKSTIFGLTLTIPDTPKTDLFSRYRNRRKNIG